MMEDYRQRVRTARQGRSTEVIYNSGPEHASVLIEELFNAAERHVGILTQKLDSAVYGRATVINSAQAFLERDGAELVILVEEGLEEAHPFLTQTADDPRYRDKVSVKTIGEHAPTFNFMVSDGIAYRFEHDKSSPSAMACFNARNVAARMRSFTDQWAAALPDAKWGRAVAA